MTSLRAVGVTNETVLVAHVTRGCFSFARELAAGDVAPFNAVTVSIESGSVRSVARADR